MYDNITIMLIAMFRTLFSDEYRVQQLIADLADDDVEEASEAAEELGERRAAFAVPALLQLLAMTEVGQFDGEANARIDLRQDVVRALGRIGDERSVDAIAEVLQSEVDRGVRYEALHALRQIGTSQALQIAKQWQTNRGDV